MELVVKIIDLVNWAKQASQHSTSVMIETRTHLLTKNVVAMIESLGYNINYSDIQDWTVIEVRFR